MQIPVRRSRLERDALFGFSCSRCLRCCRHKRIQVNPYESARLASNLGISTTEFLERYTTGHGAYLHFLHDGRCCFLGPVGCGVHADRPLVCRLYPLSRHVNDMGDEWFSELQPEDGCSGMYQDSGTVGEYLQQEGAARYMDAADRYLDVLWEMMGRLAGQSQECVADGCRGQDEPIACLFPAEVNWMDMDAVVSEYCKRRHLPHPDDIDEKMRMHIAALRCLINPTTTGGRDHEDA